MKSAAILRALFAGVLVLVLFATGGVAETERMDQLTQPDPHRFAIGVEDQLRIIVWGEPELSLTVSVRPDGKITVPLIHDVEAAGETPEELRLVITERLGKFIRSPNVTVIVEQINSFRVFFLGEVETRGVQQLNRPTRVLQAIAMAGGPTAFSKNVITLLREERGVEKRIPIDYKKLLAGDRGQENLYLRPGDTLIFK